MVPYFDPVPIEVASDFRQARGLNLANVFGLTKSKSIGVGTLIVLLPLVPVSNGPNVISAIQSSPSMVTGHVSARRSREGQHHCQIRRDVGGNMPLRRTPQDGS